LSEKGLAFEDELYDDVRKHLLETNCLIGWSAFKKVEFDTLERKEEVDLLLITKTKVFLIEAKNFLPGYEPHEVSRYLRAVGEAVAQVVRKASGINQLRDGVFRFCEKKGVAFSVPVDQVEILPLVVMYGPLGVGIDSWNCPVVDRTTLLRFLSNERPSLYRAGIEGAHQVVPGGQIFSSREEADALLFDYVRKPPIIERYKSLIVERHVPLFDDLDVPSKYRLCYFEVGPDPDEIRMTKEHLSRATTGA
jgi:hypothetical protein